MRYVVSGEFTKISETAGTIQNVGNVYPVEISDKAEADSGILLYPLNNISFKSPIVYVRCTDSGGWAEIRVVSFVGNSVTVSDGASTAEKSEDEIVDDTLDDILNTASNYTPDPEVDPIIDDMWTSGDTDTGDGFDDALDNIFGF